MTKKQKQQRKKRRILNILIFSIIFSFSSIFNNIYYSEPFYFGNINNSGVFQEPNWYEDDVMNLSFEFPSLDIKITEDYFGKSYHAISFEDCANLAIVGRPKIPFKTVKILLPSGYEYSRVDVSRGPMIDIEGKYIIEPAQAQAKIGSWDLPKYQIDEQIYNSNSEFPFDIYTFEGVHTYRGYNILVLNLYPVSYIPLTGELSYTEKMNINIFLNETNQNNFGYRSLQKDMLEVQKFVDNPEMINCYNDISTKFPSLTLTPGSYDYVIITSNALKNSAGTYTFQDLAIQKNSTGIQTRIITTEYIYANYPGIDEPEKIRNFIIDAYNTWGIEYVLLGGDGDKVFAGGESGDNIIPARGMYATAYGEIDYNITSDLYYAGLDGNWNTDSDNIWGEIGEDDLLTEVYVGRAPVDSESELSNFIKKSLFHENSGGAYLSRALMAGEDLGWNPWGGDYKDEVKDGSNAQGYTTLGFPNSYLVETLYDRELDPGRWNKSDLAELINDGIHIINHLGHCNVEYAMKMENHDVDALTNTEYAFIYSQGCYNGAFDNMGPWGSTHSNDSIVEHFVTESNGAFAYIANSRFGWGDPYGTDGASQYYDRQFFDAIFSEGIDEIGKANQDSKHDNIGYLSQEAMRWVYYELNLFGDPSATLPPQPNIEAPQLSNEEFTPSTGDQQTLFTYNIIYTDSDDNPPVTTNIIINGTNLKMEKAEILDDNYTNGCLYTFSTYLQPGDYYHSYDFADYKFSTTSGPHVGPKISEAPNNNIPSLSNPGVTPNLGLCNLTAFEFSVNYTDLDNNAPEFIKVIVNSSEYEMTKEDHCDQNYMDGCKYVFELELNISGNYIYEFNCSDGTNIVFTSQFMDLEVTKTPIFDGMSIEHVFSNGLIAYNSEFSYSFNEGTFFDVIWDLSSNPVYWKVNASDRIMTESGGILQFGDGYHTPAWLFTNVEINDTLFIAVDGEGDHLFNCSNIIRHILSGYGEVEICVMEDLTVPGGKAWYERSTGILLNGTFLFSGGSYNYTFDFVSTNVQFDYVKNEYLPEISNLIVKPITGDQTTLFNFTATYTDLDNNQPIYFNLNINETIYPMKKVNPLDSYYTDGCDYYYEIYLQPGNYDYSIECSDWLYYSASLKYSNLTIIEKTNLNPPSLTEGKLSPDYGYANTTHFIFSVNYTDIDNNAPLYITCTINSTIYEMNKLEIFDDNYMDGCIYILDLIFEQARNHEYSFECSDGETKISIGPFMGPQVKSTIFFENLYISHSFETGGIDYDSKFSYTYHSGDLFTNKWDIWTYTSFWQENITTRIMSDTIGMINFGSGEHSPVWIFPDANIGDQFNISVINDGDHIFNVTRDTSFNIGNDSYVEAWILEDLTYPGGIAFYEKHSGILLEGQFYYQLGSGEYSFKFLESNAKFKYLIPEDFILSSNADSPDIDGSFNLEWASSSYAKNYTIYQYNSYISEINESLTILESEIEDLNYSITDLTNGVYYFIVLAVNNHGETLSNCIQVNVELLSPGDFTLSSNAGDPDDDGIFELTWTVASLANNYSVYRFSSYITVINESLIIKAQEISIFNLALSGLEDGTYYFIVVAHNNYGNTLSNCIEVVVSIPTPPPPPTSIPGYDLFILGFIISITTWIISFKKKKK
ncbi:MAG: C25 family cysteine peptidase [Promethearchaeota archaeon]